MVMINSLQPVFFHPLGYDGELWKSAYDAYSGSIGRWIDAVGDRNVVHSYYNFRDSKIKEIAEEFLQEHGIKPLWR